MQPYYFLRYGFRQLIEGKCADIIQPDITWMGGITEARRMVAMAASHDLNVIPHGSSVYSYHLQYAFVNCPLAEYINLSPKVNPLKGHAHTHTHTYMLKCASVH